MADQITLESGLSAVCARLRKLADGELVLWTANDAYREGLTGLVHAGPVRYLSGRWLAGVRAGDLTTHDGWARLPLRWETTEPAGQFPVLDGDLTLTAAGQDATVLALTGAYRPPPGLTAEVDPESVRQCGAATIRGFLTRLASAITHPSSRAEPAAWPVSSGCTAPLGRGAPTALTRGLGR